MTRHLVIRLVVLTTILFIGEVLPSGATEFALERRCLDATLAIPYAARGFDTPIHSYSLKKSNGETYYGLTLGQYVPGRNHPDGTPLVQWRLLERQGDTSNYCLIAFGDYVEFLQNMSTSTNPRKRYGMPGSGFQRCSDANDVLDADDVRLWANRELGDSFVVHLTSQVGDNDFTFLMSNDLNWILINSSKSEKFKSCYYSRGPTLSIINDLHVRQEFVDKLTEFEAQQKALLPFRPKESITEQIRSAIGQTRTGLPFDLDYFMSKQQVVSYLKAFDMYRIESGKEDTIAYAIDAPDTNTKNGLFLEFKNDKLVEISSMKTEMDEVLYKRYIILLLEVAQQWKASGIEIVREDNVNTYYLYRDNKSYMSISGGFRGKPGKFNVMTTFSERNFFNQRLSK